MQGVISTALWLILLLFIFHLAFEANVVTKSKISKTSKY